eukprot:COSAG01_NODE_1398_length_10466_cov_173.518086_12_plen_102_part_00
MHRCVHGALRALRAATKPCCLCRTTRNTQGVVTGLQLQVINGVSTIGRSRDSVELELTAEGRTCATLPLSSRPYLYLAQRSAIRACVHASRRVVSVDGERR